jgi:hypothetical protein
VFATNITNVLHKYNLQAKLFPFTGTTLTQILQRLLGEEKNNVFAKLKTINLKKKNQGLGCAAHILYNALRKVLTFYQSMSRP